MMSVSLNCAGKFFAFKWKGNNIKDERDRKTERDRERKCSSSIKLLVSLITHFFGMHSLTSDIAFLSTPIIRYKKTRFIPYPEGERNQPINFGPFANDMAFEFGVTTKESEYLENYDKNCLMLVWKLGQQENGGSLDIKRRGRGMLIPLNPVRYDDAKKQTKVWSYFINPTRHLRYPKVLKRVNDFLHFQVICLFFVFFFHFVPVLILVLALALVLFSFSFRIHRCWWQNEKWLLQIKTQWKSGSAMDGWVNLTFFIVFLFFCCCTSIQI